MKNREVFQQDPLLYELVNNGVSKVAEIGKDKEQLKTLRFELETFVCDGEYARGLERIFAAYLDGLAKPEQQAAWVSGFFGSGKSHLVKMLRYLWVDYAFPDGATARSIARLPGGIKDLLIELTNRSKRYGGLKAAAGTLGAGNMEHPRLAFLQLIFRAADLPENLAGAKFILWLRERQLLDKVIAHLKSKKQDPDREIRNFYVSTHLAEALLAADKNYGDAKNAQAAIRSQFPTAALPTIADTLQVVREVYTEGDQLPCILVVVDEVQQYIGDKIQRAMDVQEIAEHCGTQMDSRLLLVGTGQSALTGTASLSRLQARFTVKVPLSDTDVENVIRQTVLAKKPEKVDAIKKAVEANAGEVSRHLQNTRIAPTAADEQWFAPDYPLLPVRRRFWERVLRNVDASGTTAQLRTQLKITYDATRASADRTLGEVVPADFIYDEVSSDLLNTGFLQRDIHEIVTGQRDKTPAGALKSRICALVYLIQQLRSRTPGTDDGVRATPDTLADLLVEDLKNDGARLRQEVPKLLADLYAKGKVMQVDNEYCLQTKEGANWNHDFTSRRARILADDPRIGSERESILRTAAEQALRSVSLQQGTSRQPRDLELQLSATRPAQPAAGLALWMRHGWAEQEKTVEADAKAAGSNSPMIFGFLPRLHHEDFRQALASVLAAQETIDSHGPPTTTEATQARNSIQTQLDAAQLRVADFVRQILAGAKVFLGGGNDANGLELADKVTDAAASALLRLFPQFADADHANWPQVLNRARAGDVGAMAMVGYQGETVRHPVCKRVYDLVGPGKKGKEVRDAFKSAPFGWPQDAVDAALVILILAGNLRATVNGLPVTAQGLNQTQISNASFYQDVPPISVEQRLALKALFQKLGVPTPTGQESAAAGVSLGKLLELAESAGGDAPLPERPDAKPIRDLQVLSGNAQLVAIYGQKADLTANIATWTKTRDAISKRLPRWERLKQLHALAAGLPEDAECAASIAAIESSRTLLAEPDAVPPLVQKLVGGLRTALNAVQTELESTHKSEKARLDASPAWKKLKETQRTQLVEQCNLQPPGKIKVATEDDILAALQGSSISNRRTLVEALPGRFNRALEEAARLLEPKAVRVVLPSATIHNEQELDAWVDGVRKTVKGKLKDGPVIL